MPCYSPLRAWRGKYQKSGKRSIVFKKRLAVVFKPIELPCGQCIGCRLERSRQWAMRCINEASMYERNCFVTLTYRDECLPANGSVDVREFQLFMKRLRKKYGEKIRFFHCGEYGEKFGRPHYHACLFNFDFDDKRLVFESNGNMMYESESLNKLWPYGMCIIGGVTFESAAYVARYVMKKVTGKDSVEYYKDKKPEYVTMSRRPGIGREWYEKYKSDVYPSDFLIMRGMKVRPPKYYDGLLEIEDKKEYDRIKKDRLNKAESIDWNERSLLRLAVKENVKMARIVNLKRNLEEVMK